MKRLLIKYLFLILTFGAVANAQIKICSETGKNYNKAELLLLDENNKILSFYEVNLNEKVQIKAKYSKVAIKLEDHLPLIYKGKVKNYVDLTNPENVEKPYKLIEGKTCAIFGDFNNDFTINAMDLYIFNKSAKENNDLVSYKSIVQENNDKLYHIRIYK